MGSADGYQAEMRDAFGYMREQILSSTLFRIYRAAGGDATRHDGQPHRAIRRAAAHYVAYLIMRAVGLLGPAAATPARNASTFATALMDADVGTQELVYGGDSRIGGTLHKAIRWAFEKQGLYRDPAILSRDGAGAPEPIDVFIDDGRSGEYDWDPHWHAPRTALWNRRAADGSTIHEPPLPGQLNYIYVRGCNRGTQTGWASSVAVFIASAGGAPAWPDPSAWQQLSVASGGVETSTIAPLDIVTYGPFSWTPTTSGEHGVLAAIDAPGDRANINPSTALACALDPTPLEHLVRLDNNLAFALWETAKEN
jgi:hypothetical protein